MAPALSSAGAFFLKFTDNLKDARRSVEPKSGSQVLIPGSFDQDQGIFHAIQACYLSPRGRLVFGVTTIASAETQPRAGEGVGMGSKMAPHKMKSSHNHKRYSRAEMDKSRPGGRPISNKPAS